MITCIFSYSRIKLTAKLLLKFIKLNSFFIHETLSKVSKSISATITFNKFASLSKFSYVLLGILMKIFLFYKKIKNTSS